MDKPQVLVVDEDNNRGRVLELLLEARDVQVHRLANPLRVAVALQTHAYDVVLLDACIPGLQGLNLLMTIRQRWPEIKMIFMAPSGRPSLAVQAFRLGACEVLETPVVPELLGYALKRALDTKRFEQQYRRVLAELKQRNNELVELNETLTTLTQTIDRVRRATEQRMVQQVQAGLRPLLDLLRQEPAGRRYAAQLAQVVADVEALASGPVPLLGVSGGLSLREMQMALMIREGLTNDAIATQLHLSPETVKAHRRNIRKKLGLTGTPQKLRAYLHVSSSDELLSRVDGSSVPDSAVLASEVGGVRQPSGKRTTSTVRVRQSRLRSVPRLIKEQ